MNERHLQDRFLLPFIVEELGYREIKANTVSRALLIEEDLHAFISDTPLNRQSYQTLLRKYGGNHQKLLRDLIALIEKRSGRSRNIALFFHNNQSVTLNGVQLHLFYPSDSVLHGDTLFSHNLFSVVQELPIRFQHGGQTLFHFRPDVVFFLNGLYLGYSELKANFSNQSARKDGRKKVIANYIDAVGVYYDHFERNTMLSKAEKEAARKQLLKPFERAIHISSTDLGETYFIRNIATFFTPLVEAYAAGHFDREKQAAKIGDVFKPYPLHNRDIAKKEKLKEIFHAHYGQLSLEKEILYYNFIEREMVQNGRAKATKGNGRLIAPRPKQKFGTDKIIAKIDQFLAHEDDDAYFVRQLEQQLADTSPKKRQELIEKRKRYHNNKNVYSLLMQYAAGFGKSNIIGWTALQLKDLQRDGTYVYDKVLLVVDRIQLRDQLDSKMLNMNIENSLFVEARNRNTFEAAMGGDTRIVIVNLQKFGALHDMLAPEVLQKLANQRVVFLIDEIHRSQGGDQHDEMISIFDELQTVFDSDTAYNRSRRKKNLIVGFTATPSDQTLARFGEFSGYAENERLWVPFDAYTMQEAIGDRYILNPLENIVPIASKMIFDLPRNRLAGFKEPNYKDIDKKQIYENGERIDAIAAYVADLLVNDVYRQIKGKGKAMLAVYSIKAAIAYHQCVQAHFADLVAQNKYKRYADAPIFIVYSETQGAANPRTLNGGLSESKVLDKFARAKNGLIIVVAKLQTGFDERRLHTLFLDKEVRGINAIQTISRVNRTTEDKVDCKIVDFSYNNVNVQNLQDAFEHFSNVVVSDFDPLGEAKLLDLLYSILKESAVFNNFFSNYIVLFQDEEGGIDFWDLESDFERYITGAEEEAANIKAKAAQYFTILNRIEYVITIDPKLRDEHFLDFWRKFNIIYNRLKPNHAEKDPIEVYFDNQIGIIEVESEASPAKQKRELKLAEAQAAYGNGRQLAILDIIEARNQNEADKGERIAEFKEKMEAFFAYVKQFQDGKRLIVKIKSGVPEDDLLDSFEKIYNRYRIVKRKEVGEYFFKEAGSLLNQLYALFERSVWDGE